MDPWTAFTTAATTLGPTPGAREAWHRGRPYYAVWCLRIAEPAVLARREAVAAALAPHGLVRLQAAHVTLAVAGFPTDTPRHDDDVDAATLAAQRRALAERVPTAPRLHVGGASAFASCPFLTVIDPEGVLDTLRSALLAVRDEPRTSAYVPHVTVGAFADSRPTGPVAAALAPFRDLPPLPVAPAAVELVRFAADREEAPFEPIDTVHWRTRGAARRPSRP